MKIVNEYIDYIANERGYSSHTVRAYSRDLVDFFETTGTDSYLKITKFDIQDFLQQDNNRKLSTSTISRKISTIKSFFNYCEKYHACIGNPAKGVIIPKKEKTLPNVLTRKEINCLLSLSIGSDKKSLRDKLILELLYSTGIRLSELNKIKLDDINLKHSTIHIRNAKRNSDRIIIMGKFSLAAMKSYLEEMKLLSRMNSSNFLFPCERNSKKINKDNHLSDKSIYNIVKKYLMKISDNEKLSTHSLRHTFATHLLENGADIMAVKDLLGHKSLSSTQVYTHLKLKELKKIYNQSHPHAKK